MNAPETVSPTPSAASRNPLMRVWNFLTSFKLAVIIFSAAIVLVLAGTYAQVHEGLYMAQERWFKSWGILRKTGDVWWTPPLWPGGYLLGTLFLINMLGAHFRRFKFPPGGWVTMILHYAIVIMALFAITTYLLWSPFYFAFTLVCLLGADLFLATQGTKITTSGRKIGIDLVHLGIAVLLLGQLATDLFAKETHLAFGEGDTKHYSESHQETELAICRDINPDEEEVVAIPEARLVKPGNSISDPKLPFSVKVELWQGNSELIDRDDATKQVSTINQAMATLESKYATPEMLVTAAESAQKTPGRMLVWHDALKAIGLPAEEDLVAVAQRVSKDTVQANNLLKELRNRFKTEMLTRFQSEGGSAAFAVDIVKNGKSLEASFPAPQASSPVAARYFTQGQPEGRDMDARNIPAAAVALTANDGRSIGSWLITPNLKEQTVPVDGTNYRISLRFARSYHPFSVTLLKTTHEKYEGTETPKDFRSKVRIRDRITHEDREVEIFMNSPLRFDKGNLTFFQSQMGRVPSDASRGSSEFQVVQNPGWFSPYFGCALVAYGMCRHFFLHLMRFFKRKQSL